MAINLTKHVVDKFPESDMSKLPRDYRNLPSDSQTAKDMKLLDNTYKQVCTQYHKNHDNLVMLGESIHKDHRERKSLLQLYKDNKREVYNTNSQLAGVMHDIILSNMSNEEIGNYNFTKIPVTSRLTRVPRTYQTGLTKLPHRERLISTVRGITQVTKHFSAVVNDPLVRDDLKDAIERRLNQLQANLRDTLPDQFMYLDRVLLQMTDAEITDITTTKEEVAHPLARYGSDGVINPSSWYKMIMPHLHKYMSDRMLNHHNLVSLDSDSELTFFYDIQ